MTRGHVGWIALCCLALGAQACTSKTASEQKPAPEQKPAGEHPVAAEPKPAVEPKEELAVAATTLECALSVPASVRAGEPVEVQFKLTNRTARPLFVLRWRTPLEGLFGDDFLVTREGSEIAYQGPMKKRGDPPADSYVTIAPGASVDARIELSLAYEMKQPGRYHIEFRGPLMDVAEAQAEVPRTLAQLKPQPVKCPAVETTVTAS